MLIFYKHRRSVVMFHQTSNFSHTCLDTDFCRSRAVQNRVQFGTRHAIPKSFHVLHELDRAAVPFTFHSFKCIIQFLWRPIGSLHLVKCFIQTFGNIQQTKDITFLVAYRLLSRSLVLSYSHKRSSPKCMFSYKMSEAAGDHKVQSISSWSVRCHAHGTLCHDLCDSCSSKGVDSIFKFQVEYFWYERTKFPYRASIDSATTR